MIDLTNKLVMGSYNKVVTTALLGEEEAFALTKFDPKFVVANDVKMKRLADYGVVLPSIWSIAPKSNQGISRAEKGDFL
jgi:hypothetical protein